MACESPELDILAPGRWIFAGGVIDIRCGGCGLNRGCLSWREGEPVLNGPCRYLNPRCEPQLGENVLDVERRGPFGNKEALADLAAGQPTRDQDRYLPLPLAQSPDLPVLGGPRRGIRIERPRRRCVRHVQVARARG